MGMGWGRGHGVEVWRWGHWVVGVQEGGRARLVLQGEAVRRRYQAEPLSRKTQT